MKHRLMAFNDWYKEVYDDREPSAGETPPRTA